MDIMLDLETMGTGSNSAIIAIGAVIFDHANGVTSEFHRIVSLQSSVDAGMTIDPSTVMWWLKQSNEARSKITDEDGIHITSALQDFTIWAECAAGEDDIVVWGNGSDFDNVIMENAYDACGLRTPWQFFNNRCYRTIKNFSSVKMVRSGIHHCAVDDARSQAEHLLAIWSDWEAKETAGENENG